MSKTDEVAGKNPPLRKAWEINHGKRHFGTFAEIGAGQGVSSTFLLAGKAGNTLAKSMSAYAMPVSDAVYLGEKFPEPRRVPHTSRYRLQAMLEHEHSLMLERFIDNQVNAEELKQRRGGKFPCIFTYANTMSSGDGYGGGRTFHGWMGVRVQSTKRGQFNGVEEEKGMYVDLLAHVILLEQDRRGQYETIGKMGTNMVYAACNELSSAQSEIDYKALVTSIFNGINLWKARVDVLEINPSPKHAEKFRNPHINRELSLMIVQESLSHEALLSPRRFNVPAELCSAKRLEKGYPEWREKLDKLHEAKGVDVDAWAYPEDDVRVPVRFLSFKHNYLIPASFTHGKGKAEVEVSPVTRTQIASYGREDSIPVIFIPSETLCRRGKKKSPVEFELFDAAYGRCAKTFEKSALLITRSNDLGWIVESARKSLLPPTDLTLVLDHQQWLDALAFDYGALRKRLQNKLKVVQSNEKKSDIEREIAQLSTDAVDCLTRIDRAACKIEILCDKDAVLSHSTNKKLKAYLAYLEAAETVTLSPIIKSP